MAQRFLLFLALLVATGCAQLQPVGGNGKFLQSSIENQVFLQIDTPSVEACRREGNAGERHPNITMTCAAFSQAGILPYTFTATNQITTEKMIIRARTLKACEIFRKEFDKLNAQQIYVAEECK